MAELKLLLHGILTVWSLLLLQISSTPSAPAQLPPLGRSSPCILRERDALLAFKAGLTDPDNYLASWEGGGCCNWRGVRCSNRTGHVLELRLHSLHDVHRSIGFLGGETSSSSLLALQHLRCLDLRVNNFNGAPIPEFIGGLKNLRHLDLSNANFSGGCHPILGRYHLGINCKHSDDQPSIYIGNPGLCGAPVFKSCSEKKLPPAAPEEREHGSDDVSFFIAMGTGYVMGLWIVFCTFLFKRKWRVNWFSIYDSFCDWAYVQVATSWASVTRKTG